MANIPERTDSDYLIFSYQLTGAKLSIKDVWLKKIWEITCPSERWPLKTQTKRDVIYNIRPATWYSDRARFQTFTSKDEFIDAVFETQEKYTGDSNKDLYLKNKK